MKPFVTKSAVLTCCSMLGVSWKLLVTEDGCCGGADDFWALVEDLDLDRLVVVGGSR